MTAKVEDRTTMLATVDARQESRETDGTAWADREGCAWISGHLERLEGRASRETFYDGLAHASYPHGGRD